MFGKSRLRTAKICGITGVSTGILVSKNPDLTSGFFLIHADLRLNNTNLITKIDHN